jgi:putative membrane protein
MIGMAIVMVLFWGAIILAIAWFARVGFDGWRPERKETPTEILERRFAEGAIPVDEYHQRREVIASGTGRGDEVDEQIDSPEASGNEPARRTTHGVSAQR